MSERIQKALARAGVDSRRQIEQMIREGRISIGTEVVTLGCKVSPGDVINYDGRKITIPKLTAIPRQVILYHKPEGIICTRSDENDRETVFEHLPPLRQGRWISVGRLDINSSGLLLFTSDGEFANQLMHPSSEIEREYAVRIFGQVTPKQLQQLQTGVQLEDGLAKFEEVRAGGGAGANQWYYVVLKEGRKREVRRLWESQGLKVSRLIRIRFGNLTLPKDLEPGEYRYLTEEDIDNGLFPLKKRKFPHKKSDF